MAGVGHPPFSNDEKNFLLAEIIKAASPSPAVLLNVIQQLNIHPKWDDIPLPPGRSLNSSRLAFEDIRRGAMYSPMSQAGSISTPLSAPIPSLKRHTGLEGPFSAGRAILPKTSAHAYPQAVVAEPPLKRKRGRPTKAEQQARADAATTTAGGGGGGGGGGEQSTLATRFQTPLSASVPPSPIVDQRPTALPPVSRVPISTMITTPTAPKSTSQSSSSSGKRRRGRSFRSDPAHSLEEGRRGASQPYESPYARIPADPDETPAKTAAMRLREEHAPPSILHPPNTDTERSPAAQSGAPREGSPSAAPPRRPL